MRIFSLEAGSIEQRGIKRAIRHGHSYKGGGRYGTYGGYDISLLELDSPVQGFKTACLPSSSFDDIGAGWRLAGYGKYHRNNGDTCQTNKFGRNKYHYCMGKGNPCKTDDLPQEKECKTFYETNKKGVKDVSSGKDEIMILQRIPNTKKYKYTSCFKRVNPENPEYGWCQVKGNYYDLNKPIDHEPSAWGYCSRDCYLDKNESDGSKLRVADDEVVVNVLNILGR